MKHFLFLRERLFYGSQGSLFLITLSFSTLLILFYHWVSPGERQPEIVMNMVCLFSLFGVFLTGDHLFKEEIDQGFLEIYALQKKSFLGLVLTRFLSYFLLIIVPLGVLNTLLICEFIRMPFSWLFLGFFLVFFLCYALIAVLASVLTHGAEQQKGLVFLICLPLIVPIFLTQVSIFSTLGAGDSLKEGVQLIFGLLMFEVPVTLGSLILGLNFVMKVK